jgi:hypothetical protein
MPLTEFQATLAHLLAANRTPDSYLAGGAALHFKPNSVRYSNDLDYFHDSVERVASAFQQDRDLLTAHDYTVAVDMQLPGYLRALVSLGPNATKVEWAHDSAWRFMPTVADPALGYRLHPIDLALNKLLALVGRDEPRDFIDVMGVQHDLLSLGALCWAAAGKDPGFTPLSLLELLRRRGRYHPDDFARLHLARPIDLPALKAEWLAALDAAQVFIAARPREESGCLYYSRSSQRFVTPHDQPEPDVVPHYGRPGGVLPAVA